MRRKSLARQWEARGYGFSKPAGLRSFAGKRCREEAARAVVDTEARAEGGKKAPHWCRLWVVGGAYRDGQWL